MAVATETKPTPEAPTIDDAMHSMGTRRVFFGANVVMTLIFAFALLVMANWLSQWWSYRTDLSHLGAYDLSDRSKNIIDDIDGEIRLTSIYTSEDPEKSREQYLPRVRDLFAEFARHNRRVGSQHISEDSEKRQLAKHLEALFNAEAGTHRATLENARALYQALTDWSQNQAGRFAAVELNQGWLAKFTSFANSTLNLRGLKDEIDKTVKELDGMVSGDLPKYAEANQAVKELNEKLLKVALEGTGNFLKELGGLVTSVQSGEETFFADTPAKMNELVALGAELRDAFGAVDTPIPDDPKPALQEGAKVLGKLATWLAAEVGRIDEFSKRHSIVSQHPMWRFQQQVSILVTETTLTQLLSDAQRDVGDVRAQIRELLQQDLETRKLQNALERVRQIVAQFNQTFDSAANALTRIKDDFARIDPDSLELLSADYFETQFKPRLDELDEINKKIDELPELEIGELGEKLRQENVVVIEAGGKADVISFDEMWPLAGMGAALGDARRVFNGDAAVSQALLNLTHDKPFAQIVMTHFETEVQDERFRRMTGPHAGDIPAFTMEALHHRLVAMNFEMANWNMGRDEAPPEPIEGVPRIFLVLPPPEPRSVTPGMANMFRVWTPDDEARLRQAIGKDGKAVFLTTYASPRPLNSLQPARGPFIQYPYGLADYLKSEWGVDVETTHRVTYAIPDSTNPNRFGVSADTWMYPSMNSFTTHPIGRPLRSRRVYMLQVNPVEVSDTMPPGVHAEYVLRIEDQDRFFGMHNVTRVVDVLPRAGSEGWVEKDFDPSDGWADTKPPFGIVVASRNSDGGRAVVFGSGYSFISNYLEQPIFRQAPGGRIVFDPPPVSNVDLMVNALYWLLDRESLIAAGPVVTPVISPVSKSERNWLSVAVTIWSLAALAVGGAVLFTRRR